MAELAVVDDAFLRDACIEYVRLPNVISVELRMHFEQMVVFDSPGANGTSQSEHRMVNPLGTGRFAGMFSVSIIT